jgi:hypothetical protein
MWFLEKNKILTEYKSGFRNSPSTTDQRLESYIREAFVRREHDFCSCSRSKSLIAIERQIQHCLNGIQKWADKNGFQFSQSKTVCMHVSQLRSANADPDLKLYGVHFSVVTEFKFFDLIFDRNLTFKQHIRYLEDRCFKALNLFRVIAHKDWGADCATLLKFVQN